jgi:hypothetical protein
MILKGNKTMQNNKKINFYAALAVSIIVTIVIAGVVFFVAMLSSQLNINTYDSDFGALIVTSAILLISTLFLGLPSLLTNRYGWKTIIVTIIFQSVMVFFAVTAIAAITTTNQPEQPSPYPLDY